MLKRMGFGFGLLLAVAIVRAENCPCFRGPARQGVSIETGLPLKWSATENVAWKTPIPGEAWSSPIVWADRVFLTTATEKGTSCHVMALDKNTGKLRWKTMRGASRIAHVVPGEDLAHANNGIDRSRLCAGAVIRLPRLTYQPVRRA